MTDKPTRGRPLSPRTLRDMALDDNANASEELAAVVQLAAHIQRRAAVAHTYMTRSYHRAIGAQEAEDREKPWNGVERRGRTERRRELEMAA